MGEPVTDRRDTAAADPSAPMSPAVPAQAPPSELTQLLPNSYRMVFEESPVGLALADEHGRFLAVNPALCLLFGRPRSELIGRSSLPFTHPDDRAAHHRAESLVHEAADGVARVEKRFVQPDGTVRWAWLTFTHVAGPQGQVWTVAHLQDVTERKAAEQALLESEATLRAVAGVMQHLQDGQDVRPSIVAAAASMAAAAAAVLWELGPQDTLVVTAAVDPTLVGTTTSLAGDHPAARCYRTTVAASLNQDQGLFPAFAHGVPIRSVLLVPVTVGGRSVAVLEVGWATAGSRRDRSQPLQTLSVLAGQTAVALDQARLLADLENLAGTDALTGLPNRRSWDLAVPTLMAESVRSGQELVVALADLDRFKAFNDQFGHLAGDALLRDFAGALRHHVRSDDMVARWGGEEFAIALLLSPGRDPLSALERLRTSVPAGATCSLGFARWDGEESDTALIERVDRALYRAKAEGRQRISAAEPVQPAVSLPSTAAPFHGPLVPIQRSP